jgi:hypothetical protein
MSDEFDHVIDVTARRPIGLTDTLARSSTARLLADRLLERTGVVGVYGSWGSGKSFVLDLTIDGLFETQDPARPRPIVCYFQPWRCEPDTSLAPGLIQALGDAPQQFPSSNPSFSQPGRARQAADKLSGLVRGRVGVLAPVASAATAVMAQMPVGTMPLPVAASVAGMAALLSTATTQGANAAPQTPPRPAKKGLAASSGPDPIKAQMSTLVDELRQSAARGEGGQAADYKVVVVIDDLDRCAPDLMVDMLNWLKVHLSVRECSYLLALDHNAAARAIVGKYKTYLGEEIDIRYGYRYLEKIVNFEVELGESELVEQMAAQEVSKVASVIELVDQVIRRQGVRRAETTKLMSLAALRPPRTMLKVVDRFHRVLTEVQRDQESHQRASAEARSLPPDYAFWLLVLVAMYYCLSPDWIEDFCYGKGPLLGDEGTNMDRASAMPGPLAEFRDFLGPVLRDNRARGAQLVPGLLPDLYTVVRQLVVPWR